MGHSQPRGGNKESDGASVNIKARPQRSSVLDLASFRLTCSDQGSIQQHSQLVDGPLPDFFELVLDVGHVGGTALQELLGQAVLLPTPLVEDQVRDLLDRAAHRDALLHTDALERTEEYTKGFLVPGFFFNWLCKCFYYTF